MRTMLLAGALALMIVASGCRNPTPNFNLYSGFGSPRVAPPAAGGFPAAAPGQAGAYHPGIQQPTTASRGAAFASQPQPQPAFGVSNGWQATNGNGPAATTATTSSDTAVNRASSPVITNGTLNDASFRGTGTTPQATPGVSVLERIQQGRMRVHDATAPPGASVPIRPIPAAPVQPAYQLPPSMTSVPAYAPLRGTALTRTPAAAQVTHAAPAATERSVLVSGGTLPTTLTTPPAGNVRPAAAAPPSADGLKWRSKQTPVMEVATR